jgi:hypothetical protein
MNGNQFTRFPDVATLVRRYQDRWQFCLDRKTHSYYWLRNSARQDYRGNQLRP